MEGLRGKASGRQGPSDERIAKRVAQVGESLYGHVASTLAQMERLMSRAPGGKEGVLQALGQEAAEDLLALQEVMGEAASVITGEALEIPVDSADVAAALGMDKADVDAAVAGRKYEAKKPAKKAAPAPAE